MPLVTKTCMIDPVTDGFFHHVWHRVAENNTELFRAVFRCMPDDKVKTWDEYRDYDTFFERFKADQHGEIAMSDEKVQSTQEKSDTVAHAPTTTNGESSMSEKVPFPEDTTIPDSAPKEGAANTRRNQSKRRRRAGTKASIARVDAEGVPLMLDRAMAEEALKHIQGHLVVWPYDWLKTEREEGRWNHPVDQLAPLEI